jgi:hypothetical protein
MVGFARDGSLEQRFFSGKGGGMQGGEQRGGGVEWGNIPGEQKDQFHSKTQVAKRHFLFFS